MQWRNLEREPSEQTQKRDLKTQKVQKTINKGSIILGQVADNLIKIKHSKDMTAGIIIIIDLF